MMNRLARTSVRRAPPIAKHLAFVVIGGALLAEALLVSALAASGDTTGSMLTAEPLYRLHFAAVAAYCSISAYADQLFDALNLTTVAHNLSAHVSERLQDLLSFKIQLEGSEINIVLFGR